MMYEALLFDMNALGDIPDKDFTSRNRVCWQQSPRREGGAEAGGGHLGKNRHTGLEGLPQLLDLEPTSHSFLGAHLAAGWSPTGLTVRGSEALKSWSPGAQPESLETESLEGSLLWRGSPSEPDTGSLLPKRANPP